MQMKHRDDRSLTLRESFDQHYDTSELSPRTVATYRERLSQWERFTDNPPVGEIDNGTLAKFRAACLDAKLSPATVNSAWLHLRAILRRLGPAMPGNPQGLGIIGAIHYMKPCRVPQPPPKRVPLEDISRVYVACKLCQFPIRAAAPAPDLWRCLLVLAYTTGLRKSDLLNIRVSDIDLDNAALNIVAAKTGKSDVFFLHPVAIAHIKRVMRSDDPNLRLFDGMYTNRRNGHFGERWHKMMGTADVSASFSLHDIRRTAASEAERIRPGAGSLLLQHTRRDVTGRYLNLVEELREVILQMRLPVGFQAGPGMAARQDEKHMRDNAQLSPQDFSTYIGPIRAHWGFHKFAYRYRDRWHDLSGLKMKALKFLVNGVGPQSVKRLAVALFGRSVNTEDPAVHSRVKNELSKLRKKLQSQLGLPAGWNPVVNTNPASAGQWTIHMPPVRDERK